MNKATFVSNIPEHDKYFKKKIFFLEYPLSILTGNAKSTAKFSHCCFDSKKNC